MFKTKINYPPNGSTSKEKKLPPKPKPQFSTDFIDREKYKLSEAEMIQKKASLQSKHRQEAIKDLQERRRKLQQGIIDEDTRKVYETALTSKKIDLNPPPRKNLSQMIQYEREIKEQRSGSRERQRTTIQRQIQNLSEQDSQNQQIEKQLKETRDFIKKLQRVKKIDNIERAVDIIAEPPQPKKKQLKVSRDKSKQRSAEKKMPLNNKKILQDLKQSRSSAVSSQQQALSSIEDTIRFMQERLFSAKRIEKIKQEEVSKIKDSTISNEITTVNSPRIQTKDNLELSGLGIHEADSEDQCLNTIRRMKDMMEGKTTYQFEPASRLKQNREGISNRMISFQQFSTLQKPSPHLGESEAQVDFSLTMNQSEPYTLQRSKLDLKDEEREYERLKKSLFEEVNRLQLQTPQASVVQASLNAKPTPSMDQSSISNLKSMPTPQKVKKINPQLAKLRNQIQNVKQSVQGIKVQPLVITKPGQVMGIDFRGSINIKKHIVQQK